MKIKILMTILAVTVMGSSANADVDIDNSIKKFCQYEVYGNGEPNEMIGIYLVGVISGMSVIAEVKNEKTTFSKNADKKTILHKICQNALNNITSVGFEADFHWEAFKLISTSYDKQMK